MSKIKVVYDKVSRHTWAIRVVEKGELFGASGSICHDQDEPLVEFYYPRHATSDLGQFVTRYNLSTLLNRAPAGLCLQGGIPDWVVYPDAMSEIVSWLNKVYATPGKGMPPARTVEAVITGTAGVEVAKPDLQGLLLRLWYLAPPSIQMEALQCPEVERAERAHGLPLGDLMAQLRRKVAHMLSHVKDAGYEIREGEAGFYWETSYERSGDFAHQADATADAYRDLMSSIANGG